MILAAKESSVIFLGRFSWTLPVSCFALVWLSRCEPVKFMSKSRQPPTYQPRSMIGKKEGFLKYQIDYYKSNTGLPMVCKYYGNGASILANTMLGRCIGKVKQRTLSSKSSADLLEGTDLLKKLTKIGDKFTGLYGLMCNKDLLTSAYNRIKSNT